MSENNVHLTESSLRKLVRENISRILGENYQFLQDPSAEETVKKIYIDYLSQYRKLAKAKKEVGPIYVSNFYWKGCTLMVTIDDRQFKDNSEIRYHGYFKGGDFPMISLTFNQLAMADYYTFRAAFLHEMTHVLDAENKGLSRNQGWYKMSHAFQNNNPVADIIYRLWTTTERNAYTTYAYEPTAANYKNYIARLSDKIDQVEKSDIPLAYWKSIAEYIFPGQFKENTSAEAIKNFFVKKSRFLLSKFAKKCQQRHERSQTDPNLSADWNDMYYQADNHERIKKLTEFFFNDIYRLVKNDGDFNTWFQEKKAKDKKLTKKLAKYVWDKEFPKTINSLKDDPEYFKNIIDWAKRKGYLKSN